MVIRREQEAETEEINEAIEELIQDNEILVIMKGATMMPKTSGYDRTVVAIVDKYTDDYEIVNVLTEIDRHRDVLGNITGGAGFPYLFVNGEFIGSHDTVMELHDSGEMSDVLSEDMTRSPF